LIKYLRAVDFNDGYESKEAISLLSRWTPIDIADALELLSSHFTQPEVRAYAVKTLSSAMNDVSPVSLSGLLVGVVAEKESLGCRKSATTSCNWCKRCDTRVSRLSSASTSNHSLDSSFASVSLIAARWAASCLSAGRSRWKWPTSCIGTCLWRRQTR